MYAQLMTCTQLPLGSCSVVIVKHTFDGMSDGVFLVADSTVAKNF